VGLVATSIDVKLEVVNVALNASNMMSEEGRGLGTSKGHIDAHIRMRQLLIHQAAEVREQQNLLNRLRR
jgi:hypothetical protein